jgi:hypothetical protein
MKLLLIGLTTIASFGMAATAAYADGYFLGGTRADCNGEYCDIRFEGEVKAACECASTNGKLPTMGLTKVLASSNTGDGGLAGKFYAICNTSKANVKYERLSFSDPTGSLASNTHKYSVSSTNLGNVPLTDVITTISTATLSPSVAETATIGAEVRNATSLLIPGIYKMAVRATITPG